MAQLWEMPKEESNDLIIHVRNIQEKLKMTGVNMKENMRKSQQEQKRWYDRTASDKLFSVCDEALNSVLQLKPRLHKKWLGPYQITKKVSDVTYEVDMVDRWKRKSVIRFINLRE